MTIDGYKTTTFEIEHNGNKILDHRDLVTGTNIAIKKSLSLFLIVEFTDIIHNGVIKVVNIMNKIDIPSIPTL